MSSTPNRALLQLPSAPSATLATLAKLALFAALLLQIALYVASMGDFMASDPLAYSVIANDFATRPAQTFADITNHPFDMRIGLTLPLSLLYRAFGVSTAVTNLPCLAAWIIILLVAYAAAPSPRAKLLAIFFVVTSRQLVHHLSMLNPDLLCGALMACSVLGLARRQRPRGRWWVAGAALALVAAFLVKETALWLGPVWLYALATDLRADGPRPTVRRFAAGLALGFALLLAYLALCAWVWGDPLARFKGVQQIAHEHTWSLAGASGQAWAARLLWQPPIFLYKMSWLAIFPAALAPWLVRPAERLWVVATFTFVFLFWFGSSGLSSYSPLPLVPRMALPLLPGIFVLAALSLDRVIERFLDRSRARWPAARWQVPAILLLLTLWAVLPVASIVARVRRPRPEAELYALVRAELSDPARRVVLVCGDRNRTALSRFYFRFSPPPNLSILFAGDYAHLPKPERASVRLLNDLAAGSRNSGDLTIDRTQQLETLQLPPILRQPTLRLYDAGDGAQLWAALQPANR
jgi:hypothetical protein